jgi:hypothetical protein
MDMIAAQQEVVRAVVENNPHSGWERIVADVEIEETPAGYHFDTVSFVIARSADGKLSDPDFDLSASAKSAIIGLYSERLVSAGDKIGGINLEIDNDGQYRFDISYDKPKRLNGIWDREKEEKLDKYLSTYDKNVR